MRNYSKYNSKKSHQAKRGEKEKKGTEKNNKNSQKQLIK